jgi:hypothetical protein
MIRAIFILVCGWLISVASAAQPTASTPTGAVQRAIDAQKKGDFAAVVRCFIAEERQDVEALLPTMQEQQKLMASGQLVMSIIDSKITNDLAVVIVRMQHPDEVEYDPMLLVKQGGEWLISRNVDRFAVSDSGKENIETLSKWVEQRIAEVPPTTRPTSQPAFATSRPSHPAMTVVERSVAAMKVGDVAGVRQCMIFEARMSITDEDVQAMAEELNKKQISITPVDCRQEGNITAVLEKITTGAETNYQGVVLLLRSGLWYVVPSPMVDDFLKTADQQATLERLGNWADQRIGELTSGPTTRPGK